MRNHANSLLAASYDGDTPYLIYNEVDNLVMTLYSSTLKVKLFNIKINYRPSNWPDLKDKLPSRSKFRKLSNRRKRLVAKLIEKYIISVEASYGKLPK